MSILEALIQGIIQGVTEFLPVSSSGHLSLFQHFFGLSGSEALFFTVMLHLGTLVAVVIAYYDTIWKMIVEFFKMIGDIFTGKFKYKEASEERKLVILIFIALLPLLVFFLAKDFFTHLSEDNDIIVEGVCFLFTGSMLFLADKCIKGKKTAKTTKLRDALSVGLFQGIAVMPGVSRSGTTISVGLLNGFSREYAVTFSFILGIPTILAASVFEFRDAMKEGIEIEVVPMIVGVLASAIFGLLTIKLITWLVKTNKFGFFAYYTLILGVVVLILGLIEMFTGHSLSFVSAAAN